MLPQTFESWLFLIIACVAGFFMGQWIRNRRNKTVAGSDALSRMQSAHQRKRVSKKERRESHRLSK